MSDNRSEDPKYVRWAKAIKVRDDYKCKICGIGGDYKIQIDAHHMDSWDWAEKSRYEISNGISLCINCHRRYHQYTSFGNNTKENFIPYAKVAKIFMDVLLKDQDVIIAKIFMNILSSDQSGVNLKEATEIKEILTVSDEEINQEDEPNEKGEE